MPVVWFFRMQNPNSLMSVLTLDFRGAVVGRKEYVYIRKFHRVYYALYISIRFLRVQNPNMTWDIGSEFRSYLVERGKDKVKMPEINHFASAQWVFYHFQSRENRATKSFYIFVLRRHRRQGNKYYLSLYPTVR